MFIDKPCFMEWKYRQDFKVMPGIVLSYGTNGIKTEITSEVENTNLLKEKLNHQLFKPYEVKDEIKSAAIDKLTPTELLEFKRILFASGKEYSETHSILHTKTKNERDTANKVNRLQKSIFRFMLKKKIARKKDELNQLRDEIAELSEQLKFAVVKLQIDADDTYSDLFKNVVAAFKLLTQCLKKWDVTSSKSINRITERSAASSTITRTEIVLSETYLPILRTEEPALRFHNINGGDLYLYPGFLIVYNSNTDFAIIDYTDISVNFSPVRFIETDPVPSDAEVIEYTWFKVNKDGSPDRRFTSNYQIPVVSYGDLHFESSTGLNEVYCFSSRESVMLFQKALFEYVDALKKADALFKAFK
jgi:hypothetical protein